MRRVFLFAFVGTIVSSPALSAQEDPTPVRAMRSFTREAASRDLPQSTVVSLHEDAQGVIWIATMGGVAKIERGVVERLKTGPNTPTSEPFNAFATRRAGGVYVAGTSGLFLWTGTQWHRSDPGASLISLAEDASGRLYGVTAAGRLLQREREDSEWTPIEGVDPFAFDSLTSTHDGAVFAGGQRGVAPLEQGRVGAQVCGQAPDSRVRVIRIDANRVIWAGGDQGALRLCDASLGRWRAIDVPGWTGDRIRAMTIDRRQRVWIGGDRGNVAHGNAGGMTTWGPRNGLKGATVTSLVADRTGSVWFGFNGAGLQQWIGEAWSHRTFWMAPSDTESMFTFSLTPTSTGGFLATVFSRGILQWDGTVMRSFGRPEGITEDLRFAIEPEPGTIWAGGRQSIFESTNGRTFSRVHSLPLGFINGFFKSSSGEWWAATSNQGVLRRDGRQWVPHDAVNRQLDDHNIRHISWRPDGEVWLATGRGLRTLRANTLERIGVDAPAQLTAAYAIVDASPGETWVSGAGGIAVRGSGGWRMIAPADGLPGNTVYAMARAADGAIWVGGSEGVARYRDGQWQRFDASDGLISEESNSHGVLPLPNGDVLFGTMSGLARFHANVAPLPAPDLRLFWRGAIAGQHGTPLTLPAHDRRLDLQWAAPWPRPVAVEYRTRIPRLDDEWSSPQTASELRVENLAAGEWGVEVQARLPGATDWTGPLTATVLVPARWSETAWARVVAVFIVALAVAGVVRWRTHRLAQRTKALEAAVEEAMNNVKVLRGLLPICAHCKKIREKNGLWSRVEEYIGRHSEADFSHGMCPDCEREHYPGMTSD